jgi:hypothetical protein
MSMFVVCVFSYYNKYRTLRRIWTTMVTLGCMFVTLCLDKVYDFKKNQSG